MADPTDHREVGRQLASIEGVNLESASSATLRLWDARGIALMALARGDQAEAEKVMRQFKPATRSCGGCGETNPDKRCIGCLHDFGDA
ncbi:TPA: hypothetical protein UOJ01_001324 [Stenotrophomonas maltophilia]|uniref:hypothetical protein n=1 Tax=Stenotrophomonas maltophilia TaxID=40324 RepID=UPI002895272D|nr:hypothetical protein [Stenotrophomonas maltophilia]MDT3473915.1 hypothetical protein [Stenotrophomonas maltophilia]HEL5342794.1 hypothetical protein [Stenotrophomonas maltophilia]